MAKLEKFGSFVLLEEVGSDCAGRVYRAAKVRSTGLEKIVYLTKIHPSLAQNTALMKSLMDELKICAQVSSPNIAKVYGCGKLEGAYFISWEFVEGKDLGTVFTRTLDGFPLAVDQSLYVLSRILGALETAHAARIEDKSVLHGALSPVDVILTYEGDVKVKNFNFAHVLAAHPNERKEALKRIETYLSPEVQDGKPPDKRSDIYALGLILYRMLTGEPFFTESRDIDIKQRLDSSLLMTPFQDDDKIPAPLSDIIAKCVSPNPAHRFPSVKEFRQAIDAILLSGDFTPSTFNLAFYMHTAFRSEVETENKQMQEEQAMDFLKYAVLDAVPGPAAKPAEPAPVIEKAVVAEAPKVAAPVAAQPAPARPAPTRKPVEVPPPMLGDYEQPKKSPVALIAAAIVVVLLGGSVGVYFGVIKPKQRRGAEQAAMAAEQKKVEDQRKRLLELESQMKASEAEKEKYRQDLQALLDAEKQAKDKADKEAQARIQQEIQKKQEEQRLREEDAKKSAAEAEGIKQDQDAQARAAEEARVAEEKKSQEAEEQKRREAEEAAKKRAQMAAQVQEGQLVSLESADTKPTIVKSKQPAYPPMALKMGAGGTVTISVLVSETGAVVDVKLKKTSGSKYGLDEAAMDAAKKYQFTPALKSGKRVKVWYDLPIFVFTPPR